ncbi:MAG TPA: MFS transporter [Dehalococcoidia bacterium]|nr:MFS transporter [Dehalococcoidia bacterium]
MQWPRLSPAVAARFHALAEIAASPDLRSLQTSWTLFYIGEWAHVVALAVFAYDAGGVTEVGIVGFVRMVPAAIAVPFASMLVDRYPRQLVLVVMHAVRAVSLGLAAVLIASDGSAVAVYVAAALAALVSPVFRPAQWALLPALARTPRELVAGNVSCSLLEGIATFAGPAAAGVLIAVSGTSVVFLVAAVCSILAALAAAGIRLGATKQEPVAAPSVTEELLMGVRLIAAEPSQRLLMGLFGSQLLVRGFLNVLIVVASIELLDSGDSGVGFLNAALGVGGLIGAALAISLVDRDRLGPFVGLGLVLWGLPIAGIGVVPELVAALLALVLVGIGNSVLDVAGLSLVQRATPGHVLGRVFGVIEAMAVLFVAAGAILTPLLVELLGVQGALVAVGVYLPFLALLSRRPLDRIDDAMPALHANEIALLRTIAIFAPLDGATLQQLASHLKPLSLLAGAEVIREGDPGDLFYVVSKGRLRVISAGQRTATLDAGDYFGEIALLRNVPRTATVTAESDVELFSLERDIFVSAVSGHPQSAESADAAMNARTLSLRLPTAPL